MRPKNFKYSKYQKRLVKGHNLNALEWKSNSLKFGDIGLQVINSGFLTEKQLQAGLQIIRRKLRKQGQVWVRVFPSTSITKKPIETRMGKGKGKVDSWGIYVKGGQLLYEITGVSLFIGKKILIQSGHKFSLKTQIISNKGLIV